MEQYFETVCPSNWKFRVNCGIIIHFFQQILRRIAIVVRAKNKKYDESSTFSITVEIPKRNFADNFSWFLITKKSSHK